jgi:hypothetical protein
MAEQNETRFTIMSFNITAWLKIDPKIVSEQPKSVIDTAERRPRIHMNISASNADIICLQEVTKTEYDILKTVYSHEYIISKVSSNTHPEVEGCVTMIHKRLHSAVFSYNIWGSYSTGVTCKLKFEQSGKTLVIINCQLGGDFKSNSTLITNRIDKTLIHNPQTAIIWCGDFGQTGDSKEMQLLMSSQKFYDISDGCGTAIIPQTSEGDNYSVKRDFILCKYCDSIKGEALIWDIQPTGQRIHDTRVSLLTHGSLHAPLIARVIVVK